MSVRTWTFREALHMLHRGVPIRRVAEPSKILFLHNGEPHRAEVGERPERWKPTPEEMCADDYGVSIRFQGSLS